MGRAGLAGLAGRIALVSAIVMAAPAAARAQQQWSQRGFVDGSAAIFPQDAPNDPVNVIGDLLARGEVFFKPAAWLQFAAGADLRANSHDQIDDSWRVDFFDRGARRPRLGIRRLSATLTRGPFTVDVGKQFVRWGKADILNPTDRFAPRDFLNVIDAEFLGVTGLRGVAQLGGDALEVVWLPRLTPSRLPLIDQRWTVVPEATSSLALVDGGAVFPSGPQTGIRWSHVGAGFEFSASFFDGFNHLPNITAVPSGGAAAASPALSVIRTFPSIRTYGADAALPTRWFTLKAEAAYFTSSSPATDEYVLYVVQLERQTGEWVLVGGYAGEAVTERRSTFDFAPDRGIARSFVARASYTIDVRRSVALEGAVRQNGSGAYAKAEFSQARGQHWRATLSGVALGGDTDDFLGQYRRNSHVKLALRYSF